MGKIRKRLLYKLISDSKFNNRIFYVILSICILLGSLTIYAFFSEKTILQDLKVVTLTLLDLIFFLLLVLFSIRKTLYIIFKEYKKSRIRARIILMFSIIAIIPTILISIFSFVVFNLGLEAWFDKKVSTAIDQSIKAAHLYMKENKIQLRDTAISVSRDLNELYYELIHNPELLAKILNTQAEMRSLTEAIVFRRNTNTVMGRTPLSFALSFWTIPEHIFAKIDSGEIAEIDAGRGKIRMVTKLREFEDSYLLVGRLVDEEIINYVDEAGGAASQYKEMMENARSIQVQFGFMFILVSGILVAITTIIGAIFANKIANPIGKLVNATEKVQLGDLNVHVELDSDEEDEITSLTNAFNRMVKKIDIQQKDLALAQRAMAWSDVASRVAHEIKNPLTPISLSAERLSKKFIDEVQDKESFKKYISNIQRHTKDIQNIISEFAEYAKIPAPKFQVVDLVKILRELVDARQSINEQISYNFFTNTKNLMFSCDVTQIHQIIVNLFKNAEEALENISENKKISLNLELGKNDLEITITDSGKGFPSKLIDKVTEPYMTTRSKGTGLGLAIVKKIVQDHEGDILISNVKPHGGCVKIIFDRKILLERLNKAKTSLII